MPKKMKRNIRRVKSLSIDRSRWINCETSEYHGGATMLNVPVDKEDAQYFDGPEGGMCCLGFAAKAMGARKAELAQQDTPAGVAFKMQRALPVLTKKYHGSLINTEFSYKAININDNPISDITQPKGGFDTFSEQIAHDSKMNKLSVKKRLETREGLIKKHFATKGIKVRFTGKYPRQVLHPVG